MLTGGAGGVIVQAYEQVPYGQGNGSFREDASMDKLADYIQWMGDFPVEATGFRDADALVLSALSYFDLTPLFTGRRKSCRTEAAAEAT